MSVHMFTIKALAHIRLTTASCLPLSACQACCSNAPSLWVRCSVVGDEAKWFGLVLGAGLRGLVVGRRRPISLYDIHACCYFRRNWSLQARWLEECALRLPFHICCGGGGRRVGVMEAIRGLLRDGYGGGLQDSGRIFATWLYFSHDDD